TRAMVPLLFHLCGHSHSLRQHQSSPRRRPQYGKSRANDPSHVSNSCAKAVHPSLALWQAQRARIRQAVRSDDTEVSFVLKPAKGAESFEPSVGAKVPNALKLHPLPPPLIYQMTTLEALCIHQIQAPGADCESDDAQDRRHVSGILGSCGKRTTRLQ